MPRPAPIWALAGGGTAWALHLLAGYFVVSLGCARRWPALEGVLGTITAVCAAGAVTVAIVAWRQRGRTARHGNGDEAPRLLLAVAVVLSLLFAVMIVLGGLTVAALPSCQQGIGGSR